MIPGTEKRKPRNSSKVNMAISLVFHGVLVLGVLYFAAHEGYLGKTLKTITLINQEEKKVEKPKEPEKPPEKQPEPEQPKVVQTPKPETPKPVSQAPPPAITEAPPAIAPPPSEPESFYFEGGAPVQSTTDPVEAYRGSLQYFLQTKWDRPGDMEDETYVAEVEVAVDRAGQISDPVWKKKSGEKRWDDPVQQAIAKARSMSSPPPSNFPSRVVVRFDVIPEEPVVP